MKRCLGLLILMGACKEVEVLPPVPTPPPPLMGQIDAQAWGARISIDDYEGVYSVVAKLDVEYDTAEALFEATVVELPIFHEWYEYESVGTMTRLEISPASDRDVDGWPAYNIHSIANIDEYDIEIEIDGVMYLESFNAERNEVLYDFDGYITLTMFGEVKVVEDSVYYNDPGSFVGEVSVWSRNIVVSTPQL